MITRLAREGKVPSGNSNTTRANRDRAGPHSWYKNSAAGASGRWWPSG